MMRAVNKIVIGIILMMALGTAWSLMAATRVRDGEGYGRLRCASNLRQIGTGIALYANEHGHAYPDSFATLLRTEDLVPEVFICSATDTNVATSVAAFVGSPSDCDYTYLGSGLTDAATAETVVAFDNPLNHDGDGINVLFGDGHVDFMQSNNLKPRAGKKYPDDWWTSVQDQIAKSTRPVTLVETPTGPK